MLPALYNITFIQMHHSAIHCECIHPFSCYISSLHWFVEYLELCLSNFFSYFMQECCMEFTHALTLDIYPVRNREFEAFLQKDILLTDWKTVGFSTLFFRCNSNMECTVGTLYK